MKKAKIFSVLFFLSIVVITGLYQYSKWDKREKNGFERKFVLNKTKYLTQLRLRKDSYQFANITQNQITLYDFRNPLEMVNFPLDLSQVKEFSVKLPSDKEKSPGITSYTFASSNIVLLDGKSRMGYKFSNDLKNVSRKEIDSQYFYQSKAITPNSFIISSEMMDHGNKRKVLKKVSWDGKKISEFIPEKQIDGIFCTDGFFNYDDNTKQLIYVYYYRGQFIRLDSNLNAKYFAKTIDTVTHADLSLKKVNNVTTHLKPPRQVNKKVAQGNNLVFIQSALKADNEKDSDFDNSIVIDVYGLQEGKYEYSFYLPKIERKRLTDIAIFKNTIAVIYQDIIAVYKIRA
ncbi:hypothetical protein ABIE26_000684 [Pedobacter africanus]|uniref:Uncharacterized protein n=1 Tax=Pedobacter africanus TaxID=151894 RepID=A0ACC6KU12_9SPHI|nr:hypothetical protein [Pedobacter africanus]MDR6782829.1 hypothetical protein [Pedobacter africanus]